MAKHPSHGFGPFLSAPGLKTKRFISGWLVPTTLSAIASLHSPVPQLFLSAHDCPFSHSDTNTSSHLGLLWLLHAWTAPPPCGRCSHRTHPLTSTGPIFKPLFPPPFYFAPAQLLSQLPHGAEAGVSLSPWDGVIGCCCSAQSLAFPKQPPRLGGMGWDGVGLAGDARHEPGVRNPLPPCLFAVSDILKTSGSWMGHRLGSSAKPFGSQLPQQHRVSGLSTQTRWTQIVFPFLTAPGWQICGGERSGLTLSRLSIFLIHAAIQHFCCQPGILK